MALWASRLAKLAQALGSAGQVPDTKISTAETDTTMRLAPDGANGAEFVPGGGGTLTLPTIYAVGASASGTGNVTPGLPTGHTTNDIAVLIVHSDNEAVTGPAGYVKMGPVAGFGTAAAAGAMRVTAFWKRDGGAESDPTVVDPGDHALAIIVGVRGCPTTGDPFLNVGTKRKTTASVTGTANAGATPVDACLVMDIFAHALDSATAVFSSPANADLGSVTEQVDVATADGNGGGIGVITGTKAIAGSFAATTVTMTSATNVALSFVFLPAGITARAGFMDRQVFLTTGADTWTKPTAAKSVTVQAIGGGSSGSAGRNAATAAGGGGGGGGAYLAETLGAAQLAASCAVAVGAGGAATANADGAASNTGSASAFTSDILVVIANFGLAAGAAASGAGGVGGAGGGLGPALAATVFSYTNQPPGPGAGGTTASAGGLALGNSGGSGAGGGTTQAASAGGTSLQGAGGGGGGRSNTNFGTGGGAVMAGSVAGGATVGANGADSPFPEFGGSGAAGGNSATGPGGAGGWPGGGGGGGGSQSGAQRGGAGGDGVVVIVTYC